MSGMIGASSSNFYALEANPFSQSPQPYPFLRLSGSKGGWSGIEFFGFDKALLARADYQGIYDYTTGWKWRFNNSGILDYGTVPWLSINNNPISYPPSANPSGAPYGSVEIDGINNGYAGIKFTSVNAHLMFNNAIQGAYRNNPTTFLNEWLWYFNGGVLTVGSVPWARLTGIPLASDSQAGLVSREDAGIWTPVLRGSSSAGTPTYSVRKGTWSRLGNQIKAFFQVGLSALSGATGNLIINGLPYIQPDGYEHGSVLIRYYSGVNLQSGFTQLTASVGQTGGVIGENINFHRCGSGLGFGSLTTSQITPASFFIEGVAIYETNDL